MSAATKGQQILAEMMTWPIAEFEAGLVKLNLRQDLADMQRVCWIAMNEQTHGNDAVRDMLAGVIERSALTAEELSAL